MQEHVCYMILRILFCNVWIILTYIDHYHERIKMFHVKDAEFNPTGNKEYMVVIKAGSDRAGRFRSLGDGQVDFKSIFSKLAAYDYKGWAVMEWECALNILKMVQEKELHLFKNHIIRVTEKAFDDFAGTGSNEQQNRAILGLS